MLEKHSALVVGVFLCVVFQLTFSDNDGCSLRLKDLSERPPLLLHPGGPLNVSGFAKPDADHVLHLQRGQLLLLACPGANNELLFNNASSGSRQMNVTCAGGWLLQARGAAVDARVVACRRHAERVAERDGWRCGAAGRGRRMRVGFRLLTGFLETVGACFDEDALAPIYSNYTLVAAIAGKRPGGERALFRTGGVFGGVSPRHQYDVQNDTLRALLGRPFAGNDSITRGHLAARGGFVFWPQKRSTFFYVNASPQWKAMNAGAWAAVERSARNLAATRGDLLVVTGVYGVASLKDVLGRPRPLYMYVNGSDQKMPVPALFWKVVYDPHTREAAAVVGVNAPTGAPPAPADLRLCPDVCARLQWLRLPRVFSSSVYCCEVEALRHAVHDLPLSDVRGLLKSATANAAPEVHHLRSKRPPEPQNNISAWEELMAAEEMDRIKPPEKNEDEDATDEGEEVSPGNMGDVQMEIQEHESNVRLEDLERNRGVSGKPNTDNQPTANTRESRMTAWEELMIAEEAGMQNVSL